MLLLDPERIHLLLIGGSSRPNALEDGRSVEEGVGHDRDASIAELDVVALEVADRVVLIGLRRRARGGEP